jgi:microcystin-dependent protein
VFVGGLAAFGRARRAEANVQETLPYIGEIMLFAGNFAPQGWAMCDGQILAIAPNQALFSLLGTAYGGNGTTTFALPDLRGRSPLHWGQGAGLSNRVRGEQGGEVDHTLTLAELPAHTHAVRGSAGDGTSASPAGTYIARNAASIPLYAATANTTMAAGVFSTAGGGQPHPNRQPVLALNFIIALQGIYPNP